MAEEKIARVILCKQLDPGQGVRLRKILADIVAEAFPDRRIINRQFPLPRGKEPGASDGHAADHQRARGPKQIRVLRHGPGAGDVAVGDQRQAGSRRDPGEPFVADPALELVLEIPRMQDDRVHAVVLEPTQPLGQSVLGAGAGAPQPNFHRQQPRPEPAHLPQHRRQRHRILKQPAAGAALTDQRGMAGKVDIQSIRPHLRQAADNLVQAIRPQHHKLVDHPPLAGAAPQIGRTTHVLVQNPLGGKHLGEERAAAAELRHQPSKCAVRKPGQRRAEARRPEVHAADDRSRKHKRTHANSSNGVRPTRSAAPAARGSGQDGL